MSKIKEFGSKVKNIVVEHKDYFKTLAIIFFGITTVGTISVLKAVRATNNMYLEEKGLTEDFNNWLYNPEE